jgi:hypothetical protein
MHDGPSDHGFGVLGFFSSSEWSIATSQAESLFASVASPSAAPIIEADFNLP